jgi:hypothetical protein
MGRKRIGDRKSDLIRAFGNFDRLHANTYSRDKDQLYGFGGTTSSTSTTATPRMGPSVVRATTGVTSTPRSKRPTAATRWSFANTYGDEKIAAPEEKPRSPWRARLRGLHLRVGW